MCLKALLRRIVMQAPRPPSYTDESLHIEEWVESTNGGRVPIIIWSNPDILLPSQLRRLVFRSEDLDLKYPGPVILYSHGNGEDLGQLSPMLRSMARICKATVVGYDYCGYGQARGAKFSEEQVYDDARAVYRHLTDVYRVPPENLVLFGRSMGTGPTMMLASTLPCRGVVLQSPLLSIVRTACNCLVCCGTWSSDMFPNVDRVGQIRVPVFIIHGRRDRVVPAWHGERLHELLPTSEAPVWIDEADHNNMAMSSEEFMNLIKRFLMRLQARWDDQELQQRAAAEEAETIAFATRGASSSIERATAV